MLKLYADVKLVFISEPDAKAMLSAAEKGDLEKIKKLLSKNRQLLECTDKDCYTPLHRACYGNNIEVVEVIRKKQLFNSLIFRKLSNNFNFKSCVNSIC